MKIKTWEIIFLSPFFIFIVAVILGVCVALFNFIWMEGWEGMLKITAIVYLLGLILYCLIKWGNNTDETF